MHKDFHPDWMKRKRPPFGLRIARPLSGDSKRKAPLHEEYIKNWPVLSSSCKAQSVVVVRLPTLDQARKYRMNWSLLSFRTPPPPSINHYLPLLPSSAYQSPPPLSSARHNCVTVLHLPLWLYVHILNVPPTKYSTLIDLEYGTYKFGVSQTLGL
jgi:hypothetical protein